MIKVIMTSFSLILCTIILFTCSNRSNVGNAEKTEILEIQQDDKERPLVISVEKNQPNRMSEFFTSEEDTVKGDFNGDGKMDLMWLDKPKIADNGMECVGNCDSYIRFSDPTIPSILVKDCINGLPDNLGDLNKNGTDEIGLLPGWFSSCWRDYFVWTYIDEKWIYAVDPFMTYCNQWDDNIKPIEIDKNREGFVIIKYTELTLEPDFAVKSKSIKIKK
jgi:hypothetical protein